MNEHGVTKTILVIDDEDSIRLSFCDHLEDLGYQVLGAENGAQGMELIKQD